MPFTRKKFFDGFKAHFDATLDQGQVEAIGFLLSKFEADPLWTKDFRNIAYALATIYHETAKSMQPVEEGYYLGSARRVKAFQKGLRYYPYFGRGYVQLTWKTNYEKAGQALTIDLISNPEIALSRDVAFQVLTLGMFHGWFSKGNTLGKYIHGKTCDYVGARRIINGTDKARLIAGYADTFERLLNESAAGEDSGVTDTAGTGSVSTGIPAPFASGDNSAGTSEQLPTSDNVVVEKEVNLPLWKKIKLKIAGWLSYFGGVEAVEKYKSDIDSWGIPTGWIKYALVVGLIVFVIWLIYEAAAHLVEKYQKRHRTDSLVQANSNTPGTVLVACPEDLGAFERAGWTVIRRQNVVPPVPIQPTPSETL